VLAAEEGIGAVKPGHFHELKALAMPPPGVTETALAAKIILGLENAQADADVDGMTFGSSATIALVCWNDPSMRRRRDEMVCENAIARERLQRLRAMETEESYTVERAAKSSPAAAAVCAYIRAVVQFYTCVAEGGDDHESLTLNAWKRARQVQAVPAES
jgi:hypothetical protein